MRQTAKILNKLLSTGELNSDDTELFAEFRSPEARAELDIWGEELGFELKDINGSVYLIPHADSDLLSFSIKDIRENDRREEAFLQCYIIMTILWLLYGGKNNNPKSVIFLQIKDIAKSVDERFANTAAPLSMIMEDEYEINFTQIAAAWNAMPVQDEFRRKTRTGVVLRACKLLERQRLVDVVDDNREIRPRKRLDDLMIGYYLDYQRVEAIHALMSGGSLCQN